MSEDEIATHVAAFLRAFDAAEWQSSYLTTETLDAIAQLRADVWEEAS